MSTITLPFDETVRQRFSPRAFLPDPLSEEQIRAVLEDAQQSPSNCNTQPWNVHIVSGETRSRLQEIMIANDEQGRISKDFSFNYADFSSELNARNQEHARIYYDALGVSREDKMARHQVYLRNYHFFNAPHVAFLFQPSVGDNVRVASDVGMYAQTFLLSLASRGLAGIPQTLLGYHADAVRDILGVPESYRLLFGISFGYADPDATTFTARTPREPVEKSVTFHN